MNTYQDWPAGNRPSDVKAYFKDEIAIAAPRGTVWSWLSRPALYPYWYKEWPKVEFGPQKDSQLGLGNTFVTYVKGLKSPTTVIDIEEGSTLAWTGKRFGVRGVHSWVLVGTESTTSVVTEETLSGLLPSIFPRPAINTGHRMHRHWLSQLKKISEIGPYGATLSVSEIHQMSYGSTR